MDNMDSIEVRIPDEIRGYKERFGGFTFRQWIGIVLIVVVCVPSYYFLYQVAPQTIAMLITTALAAPIGIVFFFNINNMTAEKMIPYFSRAYVDFNRILSFETENEKKVENEMMKDKTYRKKLKKLQKLERKNAKKIERGDVNEENERIRAARQNVKEYYDSLRKEKISEIIDNKMPLSKKERKRLKKESREIFESRKERKEYSSSIEKDLEKDLDREKMQDYGSISEENLETMYMADEKNSLDDQEINRSRISSMIDISKEQEEMEVPNEDEDISRTDLDSDTQLSYDKDAESITAEALNGNDDIRQRQETTLKAGIDSNESEHEDSVRIQKERNHIQSKEQPVEIERDQPKSKRQIVLAYHRKYPYATKAQCREATGIDMKTIKRVWPKD